MFGVYVSFLAFPEVLPGEAPVKENKNISKNVINESNSNKLELFRLVEHLFKSESLNRLYDV